MTKTVFVSAGEVSGDIAAAEVITELSKRGDWKFVGLGGVYSQKAGLNSIYDITTLSTVGFTESLRFITPKLKAKKKAVSYIKENSIDVILLVDNQGFNIPLARALRKFNKPILYYFPPPVSIWGEWNAKKLRKYVDLLLCPFPADVDIYRYYGAEALFVGNPIVDRINSMPEKEQITQKLKVKTGKTTVALLPGSRFQEIETLTQPIVKASELLHINHPEWEFVLPVSHPDFEKHIRKVIGNRDYIQVTNGSGAEVIKISDIVITASGTASLESALLGKPAVVLYKVSPITFFIGKMLVKGRKVSLPNIILGEMVYPELLQRAVNPPNIANHVEMVWRDRHLIKEALLSLKHILPGGAVKNVADIIESEAGKQV